MPPSHAYIYACPKLTRHATDREDVFTLSHALPYLDPTSPDYSASLSTLSTSSLASIFQAYAEKRQPRTAALVKGARAQGQQRVVTTGPEDCQARDEGVRAAWADKDAVRAKYESLLSGPFQWPLQQ